MAIIKKYDPNQIYLSERLKTRLESIFDYSMTVIETPTGYGKTTAVKEFLKNSGKKYIWFNVDSDDREQFFDDFCAKINGINEAAASQMRNIGFPVDSVTSSKIADVLMGIEFREKTVLVLDNYNLISDEHINDVLKDLSGNRDGNLIIVCLTQAITSSSTFELVMKKKLNHVSKVDFELTQTEIVEYYKQCGIKLEDKEAEFLFQYTEGWMSALYLQMLSYASTNTFEPTVSIDNLVFKAIWGNLNRKEQDFLISMSVFNDFTVRQAAVMSEAIISEEEICALIEANGFIKYDVKERKYYIHSILKYFLENEFEKLEPMFRKKIYRSAGEWYAGNDNNYLAMQFFMKIDDYESILSLDWTKGKIWEKVSRNNKDIFMDMVSKTPLEIKKKYVRNYLVFVLSLFLLNERAYFKSECELVREFIENDTSMGLKEKNETLGECIFLQSLNHYNDIKKMDDAYKEAYKYLESPSKLFRGCNLFNFEAPSVLCAFHKTSGKLDNELKLIDEAMPDYYKLTEGNCKGADSLMRAEIIFNRGNLTDADILCEKAKYMAESRKQVDIYILALFIQARIALMDADYDRMSKCLKEMNTVIDTENRYDYTKLMDMCQGFVYASFENVDDIATWMTDNSTIETNTSILTLGFANLVYGRYLLVKEEYSKFLAISGQMLEVAGIFSNVMYKIYTYIYIAIAKYYTNKPEKAVEMLEEAVKLAYMDDIVMPFAELSSDVALIFSKVGIQENNEKLNQFISQTKAVIKKYGKGLMAVKKASMNTQSYGLTKRELEVAKLAAQRMSNKEIADMLFIAESTVKSNLKIIFNKLSINSRSELKKFFN